MSLYRRIFLVRWLGLALFAMPLGAHAIVSSHSSINSFGGYLSSASFVLDAAGAQGQSIGRLADTTNVWTKTKHNFTGFLQPTDEDLSYDTDGDGIPDVVDPDSDNDGISDIEEIRGVWFGGVATDPRSADSDGDGANDLEEWRAGTNPADSDSLFRITQIIRNSPTDVRIRFQSIGGRQYELFRSTTLESLSEAWSIDGTEGAPGEGPFNESETEFIDVPFESEYFYGVRLVP